MPTREDKNHNDQFLNFQFMADSTYSDLPAVFQTLYNLTFRAYPAFSLAEELMQHYQRIAVVQGAAAVSSAVSTAACSVQLYLLLEVRRAIPALAPSLMPGVLSACGRGSWCRCAGPARCSPSESSLSMSSGGGSAQDRSGGPLKRHRDAVGRHMVVIRIPT